MQTYKEFIQELEEEEKGNVFSSDKVSAIITYSNKTLLLKDKKWILPKGFIQILEDPLSACVRICQDQLGISIDRNKLITLSIKLLETGSKLYIYKYACDKTESTNMIIDDEFLDSMWSTSATIPRSLPTMYKQFI